MQRPYLLACLILAVASLFAQDIIVTKDAKKIDAKILEVSTSEIRYKEVDNLEGPIFILRTDEINSIIYANGKVVLYNQPTQESAKGSTNAQKETEVVAKANQMGSLFGRTSDSGIGNPVGQGTTRGGSWSLSGRSIRGTLPQPSNNFNQEGKVIVQIRVNAAGDVVDAKIIGGDVSDRKSQQVALDAARKAKFTAGDHEQTGTITYVFKLN